MEYLFWAMAGWCGTPWRRWPIPDPDPEPWWLIKIVAIVGGIIGGVVFDRLFEGNAFPARSLGWMAATCVGAFIFGRVLSEVVNIARGAAGRRG